MKFIADVNIEKQIVDFLINKNYDVIWVANIDKRMLNGQLLEIANKEKRILITNDKDFGEIVFHQKKITYGIILFRIKGQSFKKKIELLENLLRENPSKIEKHFIVVTEKKIKFLYTGG
jgi:predicted nuclease of predicted toxin-antitoxin system